jgi:lysozyme
MAVNVVADISHHNNFVDLTKAKAGGLVGIFHKATQGLSFKDPLYQKHKVSASAAGVLWGAYHFGDGSDGVQQADFFLKTVNPEDGQLLVLDFEANPAGPSMSLVEARAFVTHVKEATGRWPGFYCGHFFKELLGTNVDAVIANCWLWLAQYGPTPVVPATWKRWTFWQYTDGANGPQPHDVPGIGFCDRDRFQGTETELRTFWSGTG